MYRSGLAWALVLVVVVLLVPTLGPERVTPPARAATPRFTVTDLGTLGGATSAAYAINSAGQVAGDSLLPDGHTHAFVWGSGVMTDICPKCLDSHANAINAQGQVTGWATGLQSDDAFPKAFLYTPGQGTVLLPYLASYYTFGYGINDNGWVVGYQYIQCVGCYEEPILWKDGVRERIGPGSYTGPRGVAWGVNNVGQATGRSLAWYPQPDHAFLFDRGTGTLTDLGVPPGFEDSEGYAVTDTGTVVGRASMHGGAPASHRLEA